VNTHKNIVWIASYPKSGNTWIRLFLSAMKFGSIEFDDLYKIGTQCCDRQLYRTFIGEVPDNADFLDILDYRCDIQRKLASRLDGLRFLKTHSAYGYHQGIQLFVPEVSAGAIVVVRNPLDVAQSYANHYGVSVEKASMDMENRNMYLGTLEPDRDVYPVYCGSWSENVISWTSQRDIPTIILRYEDLLLDPKAEFRKLAQFIWKEFDERVFENALNLINFQNLKQRENEIGFQEKPTKSASFFHKGGMNTGVVGVDAQVISRNWKYNKYVCNSLGYQLSKKGVELSIPSINNISFSDYYASSENNGGINTINNNGYIIAYDQKIKENLSNIEYALQAAARKILLKETHSDVIKNIVCSCRPDYLIDLNISDGEYLSVLNENARAVGIGPNLAINRTIEAESTFYKTDSGKFFEEKTLVTENTSPDIIIIENKNRVKEIADDLISVSELNLKKTIIIINNVFPIHRVVGGKSRITKYWLGDVWKIGLIIEEIFPDAEIMTIPTFPSGLMVIKNIVADEQLNEKRALLEELDKTVLAKPFPSVGAELKKIINLKEIQSDKLVAWALDR